MPMPTDLTQKAQRAYVALMFDVLGRLLAAASVADPVVRAELAGFPDGYTIGFAVLGDDLSMRIRRDGERFVVARPSQEPPDLQITFKHLTHAFALLSFQESTPRAYANNRMVTDGDIALSMRFVRCLDRVQGIILPDFVAARALKALPQVPAGERLKVALSITNRLVQSYFRSAS